MFKELVAKSNQPLGIPFLERLTQSCVHTTTRHNYYRFLYHLVKEVKPNLSVELGVEYGLVGAYMYAANHKRIIGIDHNPIPDYTQPYYHYCHGDTRRSSHYLDAFVALHGKVGILFQDSSHHYAPSCEEWDLYSPYLADGAIWICDDITPAFFEKGVDKFSMVHYWENYLPKQNKKMLFPDVLHKGNTMGIMICNS